MQKRLGMLLVLVLALSLVFCFGATAWADDDPVTDPVDATDEVTDETTDETTDEVTDEVTDETTDETVDTPVFTDVSADFWAYDYIMDIFERGLTTGTSATTFGPEANLTRAQFVTFLGRLAGVKAEDYAQQESPFSDIVDVSIAYAYGYICWAAEIGVTTGATDTTFNPMGQLTREQMATMVNRFAIYYAVELQNEEEAAIADADAISEYAQAGVTALVPAFISLQDGNFNPQALATRAEMAQVLSLFPVPDGGFVVPGEEPEEDTDETVTDEDAATDETSTDDENAADEDGADEDGTDDEEIK